MNILYGQNFINAIRSFYPDAKPASGNREIVVRCPYCGDSNNLKHAHMYISVPESDKDLPLYDCKKCSAHGLFTDEVLRKIGCNDSNLLVVLSKQIATVMRLPKYRTMKNIDVYNLRNIITPNEKINYINNRLGLNLDINDLVRCKIFLNLNDIIKINRLQLTRHQNIVQMLNDNFIGFISYDNCYCSLRKCTSNKLYKEIDKRYVIYNLVQKVDNSKAFYVIPTRVDIINPQPIRIHIAEGQFDILSIFYNLNSGNDYQNIYIAVGGKSYRQALSFVLNLTGAINFEVHIYPDKDVSDWYLENNVLNPMSNLWCNIYIHRNTMDGEKDYGVPKDRIIDSVIQIK